MDAYTEGIVLRQTKILRGRRMITLFSKEYGKLGAGTSIAGRGQGRSLLAIRPFTHGNYGLRRSRDAWHINSAEVLRGFYRIAEDPDKFASCSYALEFTEKLLPEESPAPELFALLTEYFDMMERRRRQFDALTVAFLFKAIRLWGAAPEIERCARCGRPPQGAFFYGIRDGGLVCGACRDAAEAENIPSAVDDRLLYPLDFAILNVIRYFLERPLGDFAHLAPDESALAALKRIAGEHAAWHLGVSGIKSEEFFNAGLTTIGMKGAAD
ncbi:MAG: DNA repair protein RecO [Clostridiales Family XIII bacterium]|jgi:DNA repair protein RecO (recombination protein O)|nr:DNA repair protein RecO [Clostridiales Family XIII bacterium]